MKNAVELASGGIIHTYTHTHTNTHTKFHDDRFRLSNNLKVITSAMFQAAVLVFLMEGIYEVRR
jgi:hypothetical protein